MSNYSDTFKLGKIHEYQLEDIHKNSGMLNLLGSAICMAATGTEITHAAHSIEPIKQKNYFGLQCLLILNDW